MSELEAPSRDVSKAVRYGYVLLTITREEYHPIELHAGNDSDMPALAEP